MRVCGAYRSVSPLMCFQLKLPRTRATNPDAQMLRFVLAMMACWQPGALGLATTSRRLAVGALGAMSVQQMLPAVPALAGRPEGVNKPELLPKEQTNVIDLMRYLTSGEVKKLDKQVEKLEKDTGFRLRCGNASNPRPHSRPSNLILRFATLSCSQHSRPAVPQHAGARDQGLLEARRQLGCHDRGQGQQGHGVPSAAPASSTSPHDHTHLASRRGAGAGAATPPHPPAARAGLTPAARPSRASHANMLNFNPNPNPKS